MALRPLPAWGLLLLLAAAAAAKTRWYAAVAPAPPEVEAAWAQYDWYVVDVKYSFHTRVGWQGLRRATQSHTDLRLVVKALTQEGSQIGTLNIPSWNRSIESMEATLIDSAGKVIPIDQERVRRTYEAKGMVVLPRVTRGCVVAVHIRQGPFTVLDYWEYPMAGPVPAWRSSFEFIHPRDLSYRFREYNGLGPPALARKGRETSRLWTAGPVLPVSDVPFGDAMGARPRLVITREDAPGGFPDWKTVAERRRKDFFARTRLDLRQTAHRKAQELVARAVAEGMAAVPRRSLTDSAKAALLLEWVQDNIAQDAGLPRAQDPDRTLEIQRGNMWHMASLLGEMYGAAGLTSDILLTRDREQGGLDSGMVAPDAAWEPVVAVRAGDKEWAACPHLRAYGLGDYPPGLFGMQGLRLRGQIVTPLPPPAHPAAVMEEVQEIPLDAGRERRLTVRLSGPFAGLARARFFAGQSAGATDTLAFCRSFLKAIGFGVAVRACAETNMERRNLPLRFDLVLDPLGPSVERGGARQWSLPDLFSRPAWFYDSARTEDYHFPFDQHRRQTAVFPRSPGGKPPLGMLRLDLEIPCQDSDKGPLKVACRRAEETGRIYFTRETLVRRGRYGAADLRQDHAGFAGLDRVGESRVTLR